MKQFPAGRVPGVAPPKLPPGQILLDELYFTVQGEGRFQGYPTVFVRTSHCTLRCTWCFGSETRVMMADFSWKRIADVRIGDAVIGRSNATHRLVKTIVTAKSISTRETILVNGSVVTTRDHRFLERSRWRRIDRLVGRRAKFAAAPTPPMVQPEYERGYLAGVADGDGCFWDLRTGGKGPYRRFRLALNDVDVLHEFCERASRAGFELYYGKHGRSRAINGHLYEYGYMNALWLTTAAEALRFQDWLDHDLDTPSWQAGYLAGIFDAEGSYSHTRGQGNHLFLAQQGVNPEVRARIVGCLRGLGFTFTNLKTGFLVHSAKGSHLRFFAWCKPVRLPMSKLLDVKPVNWSLIEEVTPTGREETVVDISTVEGSFVAEGFIVHNCDSKHTFTGGTAWKTTDVLARAAEFPTKHVCLTGGEPLLQSESFTLARTLAEQDYTIEIETSGSEDISAFNRLPANLRKKIVVNLDIKCPGSAMTNFNRWENLAELQAHDQVKFILLDEEDYEYAKKVLREHPVPCEVFLHPVWGKLEPTKIADWLKRDGLNARLGLQMHKYLWGDVRGV